MPGVINLNPNSILYDSNGNPVGVILDSSGSIYRLQTESKLAVGHGLATEAKQDVLSGTLVEIKNDTNNLDVALSTRATEITLSGVLVELEKKADLTETQPISAISLPLPLSASTENTLLLVKTNTDKLDVLLSTRATELTLSGVLAKLTDTLDVALSTRATQLTLSGVLKEIEGKTEPIDLQRAVLYNVSGNQVNVSLDGAENRLETDSKISKGGSGSLVHLDAIDTLEGRGRLKATLYTIDGDAVSFSSVSPNPATINNKFVTSGSFDSLLVDGSVTPVIFSYLSDPIYDISIQEIKFVLVSNSITFGSNNFGATAGPLTNGLLTEVTANGNVGTLYNLKQNESFVNFASPGGFQWVVSSKDMMSSTYLIGGGLKLIHSSSDNIKVTVRDNISSVGTYLKCFIKGNLLSLT